MTTITKKSFGRFESDVEDWGGELILPVGDRYEIHPAAEAGRWAVVNHTTGQVATVLDSIEDAVEYAKSADQEDAGEGRRGARERAPLWRQIERAYAEAQPHNS